MFIGRKNIGWINPDSWEQANILAINDLEWLEASTIS
jgi:hypothetical protein